MSFTSGRVSFARFFVAGDGPKTVDETLLAILKEHAFRESTVGKPEEVEAGWVTGVHLFDTQFDYEKNGYGTPGAEFLLFALRIDTHKAPADVRKAYRTMHEAVLAAENPSGFASKSQKREAGELALRQLDEEPAAGKYRKSKMVPLVWDLAGQVLYCGATGNTVVEQLVKHLYTSFNLSLSSMTSGALAGRLLAAKGRQREYEDLQPSPFTRPPADASVDHEEYDGPQDVNVPAVPWATGGMGDPKDFAGNEFAIWLWWMVETHEGLIPVLAPRTGKEEQVAVVIDKALDMDCAWDLRGKQTLRGNGPTRLPEAGDALLTGKWPRKMGLIVADKGGEQFELTLQMDRWQVGAALLPDAMDVKTARELTDARLGMTRELAALLDSMYASFLEQRAAQGWSNKRTKIREWIRHRLRKQVAVAV